MPDSRAVTVITDSTADIPQAVRDEYDIRVVPLSIQFGTESFRDGIDLTSAEFLTRLQSTAALPTTSQPPVTAFETVFRGELDRNRDVVCVTISSGLSGTFNSARLAADAIDPDRIAVIDSLTASMALGWTAVAAAREALEGSNLAVVTSAAMAARERTELFAVLRTLEYVHKGGRIGRASALIGSALAIKPILGVVEGTVTPIERVRTWNKAVARVIDLVKPNPTDIMVLHSGNLEDAATVTERLRALHPGARLGVTDVGATITTYAGPGAVGVATLH